MAELLRLLQRKWVYVGVMPEAWWRTATFGETYRDRPSASGDDLTSEPIVVVTPQGERQQDFRDSSGVGLVDFALIPHVDHEDPGNLLPNAQYGPQVASTGVRN